jgi:hypothetical protein
MSGENEFQMIRIRPFQKKEMEGGEGRSQLGGPWKVPLLGGQWKVPLFGGQWKVLLVNGLWKDKEYLFIFTSSGFPPYKFYLNLQFFPLTSRFYFIMVLGRYLHIPFFFLDL